MHWKAHRIGLLLNKTFKRCISIGSKWTKDVKFTSGLIHAVRPNDAPYDQLYH